ncbi:MAG TPA: glycosyltransferase [Actinomycetota bacterium]|nr:glycosyltransferase [Actinomycetota bacterium]
MSAPKVVAVCPVLNPPATTPETLATIRQQVADLVVVDDGSSVPVRYQGTDMIRLPENRGIAAALNRGVAAAVAKGATHVLTVDQDSRFPAGYVAALLSCESRARRQGLRPGAVGAVEFSGLRHKGRFRDGVLVVAESIQSGTLFPVEALSELGGFDEELVIDAVDTDACLRLQELGYDVCVAPAAFDHSLGQGHFVSLLGRKVWSSKHPPFRRYYITRNGLAMLHRYGLRHPRWAVVYARKLAVATLLAARDPDTHQRSAIRSGLSDGWHGRLGKQRHAIT